MLNVLAILLLVMAVIAGVFDVANLVAAAIKYWRISCGVLTGVSIIVVLCVVTESVAVRWIAGFFIFAALLTVGVIWEQTRGRLKEDDDLRAK